MVGSPQEWTRFFSEPSTGDVWPERAMALAGQSVCVTGAGGYIGSALAQALSRADCRTLILLDSSEQNLFEIQRRMTGTCSRHRCQFVLGSVADAKLLDDVFAQFRPQVVFHAAAFKHVGLLERNPLAAIRNNALASYTLAQAARRHGVSNLLLVSTDKAVYPHSVLGLSKRIAEILTLSSDQHHANVIRLCNVFGSTGSVVPLLLEQAQQGGPLTVTHPEASRYFLSREEAVNSILAAVMAQCAGCVLLPALTEPVRIAELAGYIAGANGNDGKKADLVFTGLRPGEKLSEDLLGPNERQTGTIDDILMVVKTSPIPVSECESAGEQLSNCVERRDMAGLLAIASSLVPEYVPSSLLLQEARVAR